MKEKTFFFDEIKTVFGNIFVLESKKGICFLLPLNDSRINKIKYDLKPIKGLRFYKKIKKNLINHLTKKEKLYKFPISFIFGTNFQIKIWKELLKIPYGSFSNYSNVAEKINNSKAVRAVGNAIGKNPIMIYVPCHRVLCKSGKLGGYAWGIQKKKKLLHIEIK